MAKISLLQKIAAAAVLRLGFTGLTVQKAQDGSKVVILQLEDMIPNVRGSQEIEIDGVRHPVVANDVTEIKVHQDDLEAAEDSFEWDEDTETGTYEGEDLILDVSKGGQVWLRSNTFANDGNKMRAQSRDTRNRAVIFGKATSAAVKGPKLVDQPGN
jgi:hypothetical protein